MTTDFVLVALGQALYARQLECKSNLVHRSNHRSQYVSFRSSERLAEVAIKSAVASKADKALAETIDGLYKAGLIHRSTPEAQRGRGPGHRGIGCPGSTITVGSTSPSSTSHRPKPRRTTTFNSPLKRARRQTDLTQWASAKRGAVHTPGARPTRANPTLTLRHR